jgi:hypothetical protein
VVVVAPPGATEVSPSSPEVVTSIWLKFGVTLFWQAFGVVAVPALAELAGRTKTATTAKASTASAARLRGFDRRIEALLPRDAPPPASTLASEIAPSQGSRDGVRNGADSIAGDPGEPLDSKGTE